MCSTLHVSLVLNWWETCSNKCDLMCTSSAHISWVLKWSGTNLNNCNLMCITLAHISRSWDDCDLSCEVWNNCLQRTCLLILCNHQQTFLCEKKLNHLCKQFLKIRLKVLFLLHYTDPLHRCSRGKRVSLMYLYTGRVVYW